MLRLCSLAHQRVFRDRLNPLDSYNDTEFISRYRLIRCIFIELHDKIVGHIHRSTIRSHSIPTIPQLGAALQLLATVSFQTVIATTHGISQPSMLRCVAAASDDLCSFAKDYINFPTQQKQIQVQQAFLEKAGFPLVLGSIDCSHVPILAQSNNEEIYVVRKTYIRSTPKLFVIVIRDVVANDREAHMAHLSGDSLGLIN